MPWIAQMEKKIVPGYVGPAVQDVAGNRSRCKPQISPIFKAKGEANERYDQRIELVGETNCSGTSIQAFIAGITSSNTPATD